MNQQGGVGPLPLLPVDGAGDVQGRGEGDSLIGGEDAGPHGGEAVQALAEVPLLVPGLEIPGGHVVEDGVAENIVPRVLRFHVFGGPPNNDRQLGLIVQPLHQALIPGNDPVRVPGPADPLGEVDRHGLFLGEGVRVVPRRLLGVVPVVHPQADHVLSGPGDGGQQLHVLQGHGPAGDGQGCRGEGLNQGVHIGIGQEDHAVPLFCQSAHALLSLIQAGHQFHDIDSFSSVSSIVKHGVPMRKRRSASAPPRIPVTTAEVCRPPRRCR